MTEFVMTKDGDVGERKEKLPALSSAETDRALIKEVAMDIGKNLVAYIEVMYPQAIEATSSTFKLSVRNHVFNDIMAALEVIDANEIRARLERNKKHRREWVGSYRKMRRTP